jgi:hypothetical protein
MAFLKPYYSNEDFVKSEDWTGEGFATPLEHFTFDAASCRFTEVIRGMWWVRLSANGYMDCTDWSGPYPTYDSARRGCELEWDVNPDTGDSIDEDSEP